MAIKKSGGVLVKQFLFWKNSGGILVKNRGRIDMYSNKVPMNKPYNIQNTNICNGILHISFLARLFEEKSWTIVVTPASASGSVKFLVKFFVRVYFSKTIKGIHLKLGILVHYQKRNQLQQGRWPCDLHIQSYLPLFRHST